MSEKHKFITGLEKSGDLKKAVKFGLCSVCVLNHLEIYRFVDARMKTGSKKNKAVQDAEIQFKVCRATVFNILKSFE